MMSFSSVIPQKNNNITVPPIDISEEQYNYLRDLAASTILGATDTSTEGSHTKIWYPDGTPNYVWTYVRDFYYTVSGARDQFQSSDLTRYMNWVKDCISSDFQVPDHIYKSKTPIQNSSGASRSVLDNNCFFIHLAYELYLKIGTSWYNTNKGLLKSVMSFPALPFVNGVIYIPDYDYGHAGYQGYGFNDSEFVSGFPIMINTICYTTFCMLSKMASDNGDLQDAKDYDNKAQKIKSFVNANLFDFEKGLYRATINGKSSGQYDIWGNAFAVHQGIATNNIAKIVSKRLISLKPTWYFEGGVRHIAKGNEFEDGVRCYEAFLTSEGIVTADPVESVGNTNAFGKYQNGGYWFTPVAWIWYTIAITRPDIAAEMVYEAVLNMQMQDSNAPFEWISEIGEHNNPKYVSSVTLPLTSDFNIINTAL